MANHCYFEGKLVGKKEEVQEVFGYFKEYYNYDFVDHHKMLYEIYNFTKDLEPDIFNLLIPSSMALGDVMEEMLRFNLIEGKSREEILEEYKRIAEDRLRDSWEKCKAFGVLFDEISGENIESGKVDWDAICVILNQKFKTEFEKFSKGFDFEKFLSLVEKCKSDLKDLPKKPHFWRVFEIDNSQEGYYELGDYVIYFWGTCAWSIESALARYGDYARWEKYYDQEWFKGTCIEEVHEKFPELKMEIFSEGEMNDFSEHLVMKKDTLRLETEDIEVRMYDSIEEAKEDGVEINEEELDYPVYKKLPSWYYLGKNDGSVYKVWEL